MPVWCNGNLDHSAFDLDRSCAALLSLASLRHTFLRFLFHPPSPPFGVTGFPCTIYSRLSGLLGLAYFYQFATQISTLYFDLHLSISIRLGWIPLFYLHTDCSLHTFRELSVFPSLISLVFDHSFLTSFLVSSGSYHRNSDDHFHYRQFV